MRSRPWTPWNGPGTYSGTGGCWRSPLELKRMWDSDSIGTNFYNQKIAMIEDGFYPYTVARNVEDKFKFMWMHVPRGR